MFKYTQTIRQQQPTNCWSVFNHFVGLALKGLNICSVFNLPFQIIYHSVTSNNCNKVVPPVCTVVVILCWYSKKCNPRSFPETVTVKNWAIFTRHFPINIKHTDSPLTLNWSFMHSFLLIFHAGLPGPGSNNFRNSSNKEKTAGSTCFLTLYPLLMTIG